MKKIFFLVCFAASTSFAAANNTTPSNGNTEPEKEEVKTTQVANTDPKKDECGNEQKPECRVTCGYDPGDGNFVSVSAGNIFTSCDTAYEKCIAKLAELLF